MRSIPPLMDLLLLPVLILVLLSEKPTPAAYTLPAINNDCRVLLDLKPTLGITNSSQQKVFSSWNNTLSCCQWSGVTCSRRHPDIVSSLMLSSLGLTGAIPPSLANLSFLRVLDLSGNKLHGVIPHGLGSLGRLEELYLHNNSLEGTVPEELGNLPMLEDLNLMMNKFHGVIPKGLGNCTSLRFLSMNQNYLTGVIPLSIANLSSLTSLRLAFNNLSGSIPEEIGGLANLETLDLLFNGFTGEVPPMLYNSSAMRILALGSNRFTGILPPGFGNHLPSLQVLYLYSNHFEGPIPTSINNASALLVLGLGYNSFGGVVPANLGSLVSLRRLLLHENLLVAREPADWSFLSSLTACSKLEHIDLTGNKFGGALPDSIGNLSTALQWLRLRKNQITGRIPAGIGNLTGLVDLDIEFNQLTGSIPETIGKLLNMEALSLRGNILTGSIPSSLGNLVNMSEFYLNSNNLSGGMPESFASLNKLEVFDISYNELSGVIPKGVLRISSLSSYLNLSHNTFVGTLPEDVGKLKNLKALDASYNRFSGGIPHAVGECQLLEYLSLQGNLFNGVIPEELSKLKGLQILDISRNHLSGSIPKFLETLPTLEFLNLSFNDLEGEVPTGGIFRNLSSFSIIGNVKLCVGDPKLNLSSCWEKKKGLAKPVLAAIIAVGVLVCLITMVLLFRFLKLRLTKNQVIVTRQDDPKVNQLLRLSYHDLKRSTNGFAMSNLIGKGAFGSVYSGILEPEREVVAVKVFHHEIVEASKSFMEECMVLRNIRHRNLVRIVTACVSEDEMGNEFKALVYEFMPNGSLDMWIHEQERPGPLEFIRLTSLNLLQILNIAIGIASGLDYLHNQIEMRIAHCDLKPSNILLNDDMTARISDFGISRILPPDTDIMTSGIKGTIGYIPPEFAMGSPITTSWDVYSFGVLLLEMLTGKRPTEIVEALTLVEYVRKNFPLHMIDILDKNLLLEIEDGGITDKTNECLISAIRIALACSGDLPKERIGIRDALMQLEEAKTSFLKV